MKVYTYTEARQRLAHLLDLARREEVQITRRGRETFTLRMDTASKPKKSPLGVEGIKTKATTADILSAIEEGRRWPRRAKR